MQDHEHHMCNVQFVNSIDKPVQPSPDHSLFGRQEQKYLDQIADGNMPVETARKTVESITTMNTIDNRCDFQRLLAAMSELLLVCSGLVFMGRLIGGSTFRDSPTQGAHFSDDIGDSDV
eukprot:4770010-Amphidinium_carterae.1